jgi:acyl dehydratase
MTAAALIREEGRLAKIGDRVELVRVFTQQDFDRFAKLSGDDNPIHVDPAFAATTHFGRTVSHGMLLYAVLAALVRRGGLAGKAVGQKLMFPNPTFTGEPVRFSATVVAVEGEAIVLAERVERLGDGAVVCEGEARYARGGVA